MSLFVGNHVNRIDKKGRVSVPKPFRAVFHGRGQSSFFAYPLFKHQALEACGEDFMLRLSESLDDLDMFSDEQDDLAAVILENAHQLHFDPEGRVALPKELTAHAGVSGEVAFVGRGNRFQIWEPKAYAAKQAVAFERARSRGATLKLRRDGATGDGPDGGGGDT